MPWPTECPNKTNEVDSYDSKMGEIEIQRKKGTRAHPTHTLLSFFLSLKSECKKRIHGFRLLIFYRSFCEFITSLYPNHTNQLIKGRLGEKGIKRIITVDQYKTSQFDMFSTRDRITEIEIRTSRKLNF